LFQNFLITKRKNKKLKIINKNKIMAKGNASKFLEGAVAGLALGVAASMLLATKKGKALQKDAVKNLEDITADFYKYISPKVKKIKKMGEKEYKEFMKNAAGQYAKTKKISEEMAKQLIKESQQSWKHFSKHLGE
jgi:gas vesicle protein